MGQQDNIYADTAESGINSVINGLGNPATKQSTKQMVVEYPAAE